MTILHSLIFGIVEGVTEFLPISSTAHLEIAQRLLNIASTDFVKSFEIAIQLGAITAVVLLYKKKLFSSIRYFRNIILAFIPTAIIGFSLYKIIKNFLFGNLYIAALMLLIGGIIIIFYERKTKNKVDNASLKTIEALTVKELLTIGCAQALAVVPGVSRSGAVIISGRMLGLNQKLITEFSFLLAIPTMLAATAYDLLKSGFYFSSGDWTNLVIGFAAAFITALFAVKWLLDYIKTHNFTAFGYYRIALGILLFLLLIL